MSRSLEVPPGHVVRTGYVSVWSVRLGCCDRIAVGDVGAAYDRLIRMSPAQPWPCPHGHWEGERFVVEDGRHEYIAQLMLGKEYILVGWLEAP